MDNRELVRSLYDSFQRGDVESILNNLTDDFIYDVPGPAPFAGRREGRDGMRRFFEEMGRAVQYDQFDVNEILADGDKVIVLGQERATVRATGTRFETEFAHVYTVRDGKLSHGRAYADTAAFGAAFGETARERQALTGSLGVTHKAFSGRGTPE
jgi:ketosteroid isomerase-like protein